MFCKYCGCQNADEVKFCKKCGKGLEIPPIEPSLPKVAPPVTSTSSKDKPTTLPPILGQEILYCNSINHVAHQMNRVYSVDVCGCAGVVMVLQLLFTFFYNKLNIFQQAELHSLLFINSTTACAFFICMASTAHSIIFSILSKVQDNMTHEELHITTDGIWGVTWENKRFSYHYDEIKSVTESDMVPKEIRKKYGRLASSKCALKIELHNGQILYYALIGRDQIKLISPALKTLMSEATA